VTAASANAAVGNFDHIWSLVAAGGQGDGKRAMQLTRNWQSNSEARPRVLIVDDEDSLRDSLYRNLESDGYDVLAASNGADALEIFEKSIHPIELLVTDYNMPQMTGLALARECARLHAKLSVLYISGANPNEELRADLEAAKRAFLAKPYSRSELLRKAKELLLMEPAAPSFSAPSPAVLRGRS
jgi:CheY-like chemotaxis protein